MRGKYVEMTIIDSVQRKLLVV